MHDFELPFGEDVPNENCDLDDELRDEPGEEVDVPAGADDGTNLNKSNVRDVLALHRLLLQSVNGTDLQQEMTYLANCMGIRSRPALVFVWKSLELEESSLVLGQTIRRAHPGSSYVRMDYAWALTVWVRDLFSRPNHAHALSALFETFKKH
ncbi:hypothetical protein ACEPAG_3748 [Sanghuangporus baumii]